MAATVTVSMRLTRTEAKQIERLAADIGFDRSTFMKQALRRGCADVLFEHAAQAYRRGDVTLSRAAELANVPLRGFILRLREVAIELNYGLHDLRQDLRP